MTLTLQHRARDFDGLSVTEFSHDGPPVAVGIALVDDKGRLNSSGFDMHSDVLPLGLVAHALTLAPEQP